jgi:alpha,alpha-trehalase
MKHFLIETLSPLYEVIQKSGIFADSKFFVDCSPKTSPMSILADFEKAQLTSDFDLKKFIEKHFSFPETSQIVYETGEKTLSEHLDSLWSVLSRKPDEKGGTLIALPYPYIVPGGRFREIYYWDSYFTMLGLQVSGKINEIENMVSNFAYLIDNLGFIPNGNRTYYLGRSQPPFFSLMVKLLAEEKGKKVLQQFLPQLEKEYTFWMNGSQQLNDKQKTTNRVVLMPNKQILNRYWDSESTPRPESYIEDVELAEKSSRNPADLYRNIRAAAESGWDFSSRWFAQSDDISTIETTDLLPVDLNCLLLHLEQTLLETYELNADDISKIKKMQVQIKQRKSAILRYCWNEDLQFFTDYHLKKQASSDKLTLAAVYPLFFNLAKKEQAEAVAIRIKKEFLQEGGVVTTLEKTGQQWDAPNGWAPLQWMTYKGLNNYKFYDLAEKIKDNWLIINEKTFLETGKMMEKYNVMNKEVKAGGGEYPNQDGFGWTNGVYLKLNSKT